MARVSSQLNTYLLSTIMIMKCSALSTAIGGQDGMDGNKSFWMLFPFLGSIPNAEGFDASANLGPTSADF